VAPHQAVRDLDMSDIRCEAGKKGGRGKLVKRWATNHKTRYTENSGRRDRREGRRVEPYEGGQVEK